MKHQHVFGHNENGFGTLQVLLMIILVGLMAQSALVLFAGMNSGVIRVKAVVGRDSLANFLTPVLTEQALCISRLKSNKFDASAVKMPLAFSTTNPSVPPIGSLERFYPEFNLTVKSIYYAGMTYIGKASPTSAGLRLFRLSLAKIRRGFLGGRNG